MTTMSTSPELECERLRQQNAWLKEHNDRLSEAVERLRDLFDTLPVGIYRITPSGEVLLYNIAVLELLGHMPEHFAGDIEKQIAMHCIGFAREDFRRQVERDGEVKGYESKFQTDSGAVVHVRENARVVRDQHGEPLYYECTLEDVTQQRILDVALRASEERYRSLVEQSPVGILLIDDQSRIVYANSETGRILGCDTPGIVGKLFTDFVHPDDLPLVVERYRRRQLGQTVPSRYEIRIVQSNGKIRDVALSATVYRDSSGTARSIAQILDITERKLAEQAMLQYTQELENQNAELDAFADSVAHDLRNPLSTIIGFAEALLEPFDDLTQQAQQAIIASIARVGRKMDSIIEELLLFARVRKMAVKSVPVDMGPLVDNVRQRLQQLIASHEAELTVPERWPLALAHGPWIEEVWANYISNAISYGGRPPKVILGADHVPDNRVRFWVCDNGTGVPPSLQKRIFHGFDHSSALRPQGHGLGLALVKRIIEKLNGTVELESPLQNGSGSRFSFTLPAADEEAMLDKPH